MPQGADDHEPGVPAGGGGRQASAKDSRGAQIGDGNVQINLFSGEQRRGPVVAGNVPQAPPAFQPREELVAQLRAHGPGVSVVRAVTGMRGVGKTQLAAAYARECIDADWQLVAWINAEDTLTVLNGLEVVANRLGIDRPGTALEAIGAEVRNRVEADGHQCLIVYDNVTDPDALRPYIPSAGKSQVVVTSTQATALALGKPTQVAVFTEQESLDFLAERTGIDDPAGATALSGEVGHLPLALAQAAAVIRAQHLTYDTYLTRLRAYPAGKFLPQATDDQYPRAVAESILLSMEAVTAADVTGLCASLLGVISLLSPDGVPRDLLYHGEAEDAFAADAETVDEALARLSGASLLNFGRENEASPTVTAHRLVMRVARERDARGGTLISLGLRACALLADAAEALGELWQHREATRELVQQVIALNDHLAGQLTADLTPLTEPLLDRRCWAVSCLNELGDSAATSIGLGESLLGDCARLLGDDHLDTLLARSELAVAYDDAGRLDKAIPLYEQVLNDCVRLRGADHRDTLSSRNNLAYAYHMTGRLTEAIPLYERMVADCMRVLGDNHPDTLSSLSNLAGAYQVAGRAGEAVPVLERTLAEQERVLGEGHPDVLRSLSNLGAAYQATGRAGEAIPLFQRAAADYRRMLGDNHPHVLKSRNNLAYAYQATGRANEAVPLFERLVADYVRVLGSDHPDTLMSRNNLGAAYLALGRAGEAMPLLERLVADYVRVLGEDHPDALRSRNNLAAVYQASGRASEAIPLLERLVADYVRVLGRDHPDTLMARANLASGHRALGRLREAVPLFEGLVADYVRVLGEDHPDALRSRNNLAAVYQASGRASEAIPLLERVVADYVRVLSGDHPDGLVARVNLAGAYRAVGRADEAIPLLERTLADRVRMSGEEHPDSLMARNNLAAAYGVVGRTSEAIPLLERALAGLVAVFGNDDQRTVLIRDNLDAAREAAGRPGGNRRIPAPNPGHWRAPWRCGRG